MAGNLIKGAVKEICLGKENLIDKSPVYRYN